MREIKTLLFDLDGTLIDSRADLANAVNFALESSGQPKKPHDEIIPHIGNGLRVLLSEVFGPVSEEVLESGIASFSAHYDQHCVDQTILYENVLDILTDLSSSRQIGVVTNKPEKFSEKIIHKLGLSNIISVIVGGDSLPEKKPHPAPVLKALRDLGAESESSLFVGDGIQDIQAGKTASLLTCIARYGFGFRSESIDLKPDFQIHRFNELKEIVS